MAFKNVPRWTAANVLPMLFALGIIVVIWCVYFQFHLLRLLQFSHEVDDGLRAKGWVQFWISQPLTLLFSISFFRTVFTDPGSVPQTEDWLPNQDKPERSLKAGIRSSLSKAGQPFEAAPSTEVNSSLPVYEVKQSGKRRFCQKCNAFKPDRCHHCRVCNSCVLRMDHHCPWIANCVGFRNHKYFFLLVFYAMLTCNFIVVTISESVSMAIEDEMESSHRFMLVFGTTLAALMAFLLTTFFAFHFWLMLKSTTTIEFCEKRTGYDGSRTPVNYDRGTWENIRAVLGPNPFLWLLPLSPPIGDGLRYPISPGFKSIGGSVDEDETVALLHKEKVDQGANSVNGVKDIDAIDPPEVTGAAAASN
jgi:palmitoyltransferase ZDHHC2/15/20